MTAEALSDLPWPRLSALVAERTGLNFPPERHADLRHGLNSAAMELGLTDRDFADHLLSMSLARQQWQVLASHLTVGETYFFRERRIFDVLAAQVIPELLGSRGGERNLRIWSAACCTGEEPYSLSILLQQCVPDLADWHVTLLATDINEQFLRKAVAATYGDWSFRGVPTEIRDRYFNRTPDGRYSPLPQISKRVRFAPLNLVEDSFPSLTNDTQAMDIIFCRNVLMYFTPARAARVVEKLRRALRDDGWLVLGSAESSHALSEASGFKPVNLGEVTLYRKQEKISVAPLAPPPAPCLDNADSLYQQGAYRQVADTLMAAVAPDVPPASPQFSLMARALANQGRLTEALSWCHRWVAAEPLDSGARYLRAVILEETGNADEARRSLQQAIYLQPEFVLAHFALGNLARGARQMREAYRHFDNTLALLNKMPAAEPLPESDGLTAGRLKEVVESLFVVESAP